jgi:hypothetical protein
MLSNSTLRLFNSQMKLFKSFLLKALVHLMRNIKKTGMEFFNNLFIRGFWAQT